VYLSGGSFKIPGGECPPGVYQESTLEECYIKVTEVIISLSKDQERKGEGPLQTNIIYCCCRI